MEHKFKDKVYYADTDAYGVVWHGSYLKWAEKGRVLFCEKLGINLVDLQNKDILIPVTNANLRYKASAKLNDDIEITTVVSKITPIALTFTQTITDANNGKTFVIADITVVAVTNDGKLYRRLPEELTKVFNEDIVCNV